MKTYYLARAEYCMTENHPDRKYVKDPSAVQTFMDLYEIDLNYFWSDDPVEIAAHIRYDLYLVITGGYGDRGTILDHSYSLVPITEKTYKQVSKVLREHDGDPRCHDFMESIWTSLKPYAETFGPYEVD